MKFTTEHYNILKGIINQKAREAAQQDIKDVYSVSAKRYKAAGMSYQGFVWAVFYLTEVRIGDGVGLSSNCGIEGDYHDTHIETAVKRVLREEYQIIGW